MEVRLQRRFPAFPGGFPGAALLLLRAVFSAALLLQGVAYVRGPGVAGWLMGAAAFVASGLLALGLLTPIVAVAVAACAAGSVLSLLPSATPTLFESPLSLAFGGTMLLVILFLGPGAYSLDARLFGRREIIIPRTRS